MFKNSTECSIYHSIQCINSLENFDFNDLMIKDLVGTIIAIEHMDSVTVRMF